MLGIDTNVLVRFLVRDDEAQFERLRRSIKREVSAEEDVFVGLMVLLETEWVLRRRYMLQKAEIAEVLSGLLAAMEVQFEDEPAVRSEERRVGNERRCLWARAR